MVVRVSTITLKLKSRSGSQITTTLNVCIEARLLGSRREVSGLGVSCLLLVVVSSLLGSSVVRLGGVSSLGLRSISSLLVGGSVVISVLVASLHRVVLRLGLTGLTGGKNDAENDQAAAAATADSDPGNGGVHSLFELGSGHAGRTFKVVVGAAGSAGGLTGTFAATGSASGTFLVLEEVAVHTGATLIGVEASGTVRSARGALIVSGQVVSGRTTSALAGEGCIAVIAVRGASLALLVDQLEANSTKLACF